MDKLLQGRRFAILAENGFEESELREPLKMLQHLGATVDVISPQTRDVQGVRREVPGKKSWETDCRDLSWSLAFD